MKINQVLNFQSGDFSNLPHLKIPQVGDFSLWLSYLNFAALGPISDPVEDWLIAFFDKENHEESVKAIGKAALNKENVDLVSHTYSPEENKIKSIDLFSESKVEIQYVKITTKDYSFFLKTLNPLTVYVFYMKNGKIDLYQKKTRFNENIDMELELKHKDIPADKEIVVHFIAFKKLKSNERILSEAEVELYVSNEYIPDDQIKTHTSGTSYFLYIGLPIILVLLLVGIIILVCWLKKRKNAKSKEKSDSEKKIKSDNQMTQPIQENQNFMVQNETTGKDVSKMQEMPVLNPQGNYPQMVYGMPPQGSNMPYPVVYVMPGAHPNQFPNDPQKMQSGLPMFMASNNTRSTGMSGNNGSNMPSNMLSNMPSNMPSNMTPNLVSGTPNHYDVSNNPLINEQNNLRMFGAENVPDDPVPMFEVNMKGVDDYTPGQKFQ